MNTSGWGKRLATVALIAFLGTASWIGVRSVFAPRRADQNGAANPDGLPPGVGVRSEKNTFIGYDKQARRAWILRAEIVDLASDKNRIEARGNVEVELLNVATGKRRAFVTAPTAVFVKASQTLQVGGKIVCRAPGTKAESDLRVEAETLLWSVGAKQVICSGTIHAVLPDGGGTADGRDLTLDLATREWSLQQFHGAFRLREGAGDAPPPFINPLKQLPF